MKYKDDIVEDKTLFFGRIKDLYNMTPMFDKFIVSEKVSNAVYYLMTEAMSVKPIGALTEQAYNDFLKFKGSDQMTLWEEITYKRKQLNETLQYFRKPSINVF